MSRGDELRFSVNGHTIAALAHGDPDGVPVLGLHGWLDNAATFNQVASFLSGIRLIALDLMGHGFSDHRPASMPYYIWDNVADVIGVADELGLQQLNLVGHSMGASIATLLAGCYPQRVTNLCLIEGIAPFVYEPQELPRLMAEALERRKRMRNRVLRPYPTLAQAVEARMNGRWPVGREAAEWLVARGVIHTEEGLCWRSDPSLVLPSVLRMSEEQVAAFIRQIACPVTLVLGDEGIGDDLLPARAELFRDLAVERLAGNHHLHLERSSAEIIARRLNSWVRAS